MGMKNGKPVYMQSSYAQNQALMQALNQGNNRQQAASQAASNMLPNLGNNSSVTIQVYFGQLQWTQYFHILAVRGNRINGRNKNSLLYSRASVQEAQINRLTLLVSLSLHYLVEAVRILPAVKVKDICNL